MGLKKGDPGGKKLMVTLEEAARDPGRAGDDPELEKQRGNNRQF